MTEEKKRGDRALGLVQRIRQAIIAGDLPPGSALRQEELAATFASSRMPVREALRTLDAEGLVRLIPNRGAIVAPIDADELRENFEMREVSEVLAIRLALPHLSNAQIDRAARIQERIDHCDLAEFGPLNKAFHLTLYEPANRPRLIAHIGGLHDIADRYLRFTLAKLDYADRSAEQHAALLDACYRRDEAAAMALTAQHIVDAGQTLETYLRDHPPGPDR